MTLGKRINEFRGIDGTLELMPVVQKNAHFSVLFQNDSTEFLQLINDLNRLFDKPLQKRHLVILNCFVVNLINGCCWGDYFTMSFKKSKEQDYLTSSTKNPFKITAPKLKRIRERLQDIRLIDVVKGKEGLHYTRITPTEKFREFIAKYGFTPLTWDSCVLKSKIKPEYDKVIEHKKNYVDITVNDLLLPAHHLTSDLECKKILDQYNQLLNTVDITYEFHRTGNRRVLTSPYVIRKFCHMTLPLHGRLYSEIAFLRKTERKTLRINGHKIIELDFRACNLSILAAYEGIPLYNDPYQVNQLERELVKSTINRMLFCSGDVEFMGSCLKEYRENILVKSQVKNIKKILKLNREQVVIHVVKQILSKYPFLKNYRFYGTVGLQLMYLESEIALGIIRDFLEKGHVVLTIHDSFICEEQHAEFLIASMINNF